MKNRFIQTLFYRVLLICIFLLENTIINGQDLLWTVNPTNQTVSCSENYQSLYDEWLVSFGGGQIESGCSNVDINYTVDTTDGCGEAGSRIVTFTAQENCNGATQTRIAIFTVIDTIPPTWSIDPNNLEIDCNTFNIENVIADWLDNNGTVEDDCGNVTIFNDYDDLPLTCDVTTVTFTAIDECGNKSERTAEILLTDNNLPVWTIDPTPLLLTCTSDLDRDERIAVWLNKKGQGVAADACNNPIVYTNNFTTLAGACNGDETVVTFTATDACGNFTTINSTITIVDEVGPTWEATPEVLVLDCDGTANPNNQITTWLSAHGYVDAFDACSVVTYGDDYTATNFSCSYTGITPVTFTATDACGNASTVTTTVNIVDTIAPVWTTLPNDFTVDCGADVAMLYNDWRDDNGGGVATDNCGDVVVSYDNPSFTEICGNAASALVTFTATDECGNNKTTYRATFTIVDNSAPEWSENPDDLVLNCNNTASITDAISNWLEGYGNGVVDDVCGTFEVTNNFTEIVAPCLNGGSTTVTFTATDACGNASVRTAQLTIVDNVAPVWDVVPQDLNLICDVNSAVDLDIQNWLSNNGNGQAIDQCGTTMITHDYDGLDGDCSTNNVTVVTFMAIDICGNTTISTANIILTDAEAPFLVEPAESVIRECDDSNNAVSYEQWLGYMGGAVASDFCSQIDSIDWSYELLDEQYFCGNTFSKTVKFTVTDDCGNFTTTVATYTAEDASPPFIEELPKSKTIFCGVGNEQNTLNNWIDEHGGAVAVDKCSSVTWVGFQFDDNDSGFGDTISFGDYPNYPQIDKTICNYQVSLKWISVDECENESLIYASFLLLDVELPVFTNQAENILVECDEIPEQIPPATTDNCDADLEMIVHDSIANLSCPTEYTLLRTWTAIDNCGNTSTQRQSISVIDTKGPIFNTSVTNLTVSCDSVPDMNEVTAIDNCGGTPIMTFEETLIEGSCAYSYVLSRSWTATDSCGNTSYFNQQLDVVDNKAPVFSGSSSIIISCDQNTHPDSLLSFGMMVDNCDPNPYVTNYDVIIPSSCSNSYTIERNWFAIDACGNISEPFVQTIAVHDLVAPVIVIGAKNDTITCENTDLEALFQHWVATRGEAIVYDNCTSDADLIWKAWVPGSYDINDPSTFPGVPVEGLNELNCEDSNRGIHRYESVDFIIFDACDNVSVTNASFVVLDTIAPVIEDCPNNITVALSEDVCETTVEIPYLQITDGCENGNTIFTYSINGGDEITPDPGVIKILFQPGSHNVKYYATDCAGNRDSCSLLVTVIDSVPPQIDCSSNINFVLGAGDNCAGGVDVGITAPQSSDNCGAGSLPYQVYTTGATVTPNIIISDGSQAPDLLFEVGLTTVHYSVQDLSGNKDSCSFTVNVVDNISPVAICESATFNIPPSGGSYAISGSLIGEQSTDNCGIVSYTVVPSVFDCSQIGQDISVTLTVEDAQGNTDVCQTMVTVEPISLTPTYATNICGYDTLQLFVNDAFLDEAVYTYEWQGPNGFTSNLRNPIIPEAGATYSGTYQVVATGITGCSTTGKVEVIINEGVSRPSILASDTAICIQGNILLNTTFTAPNTLYHWYAGDTLLTVSSSPLLNVEDYLVDGIEENTQFYLFVEVNNCISPSSDTITVNTIPLPVATAVVDTLTVCEGEMINLEAVGLVGDISYQWTGPDNFISDEQNPTDFVSTLEANGEYTLVITEKKCESLPVKVKVDVAATPNTPILNIADPEICTGESVVLSTDVYDDHTYTWYLPQGIMTTDTSLLVLPDADNNLVGDYKVKITSNNGCESQVSEIESLTVNPLPEVNAYNDGPACNGIGNDFVQLFVNTTPGAAYFWLGPNGYSSIDQYAQADTLGTYVVNVTTVHGCQHTDTTEVFFSESPVVLGVNNNVPECVNGLEDVVITADLLNANTNEEYQYSWTGPNLLSYGEELVIPNITSAANGSYTLVVTNSNGCESVPVSTIIDTKNAPLTPNIYGDPVICEEGDLTLTTDALVGNGVNYYWQTPNGILATENPSLSIDNIPTEWAGEYSLVVTNNGCFSDTSTTTLVNVKPLPPTPEIGGTATLCEGETLVLSVADIPNANYNWSGPNNFSPLNINNPTIPNVSNANVGAYTVQLEVDGCLSDLALPFEVTVKPIPNSPIVMGNTEICISQSNSVLTLQIDPTSATPGAVYSWYNTLTNELVATPSAGLTVNLTDFSSYSAGDNSFYAVATVDGCSSLPSIPYTVTMFITPDELADAGVDRDVCISELVTLQGVQPEIGQGIWTQIGGPDVVILNSSEPSSIINGLQPDTSYNFIWTLSNGVCGNYASDEVEIRVYNNTMVANAGEGETICKTNDVILNAVPVTGFGNMGTWSQPQDQEDHNVVIQSEIDPNTEVVGLSSNEIYSFTWTISNPGCGTISSDEVLIDILPSPEPIDAGDDILLCGNGTLRLDANEIPDDAIGIWTTNNDAIIVDSEDPNTVITGLETGDYTFYWTVDFGICGIQEDSVNVLYSGAIVANPDTAFTVFGEAVSIPVGDNDLVSDDLLITILEEPENGTVLIINDGIVLYTPDNTFFGIDEFVYELCSVTCPQECGNATVTIFIDESECIIPTIFTPNDDGINDKFVIPCLGSGEYPDNKVIIFNEWGDEIFSAKNYQNDFDGTYKGNEIPVGTYFYLVDFNDGTKPKSGFLVLER